MKITRAALAFDTDGTPWSAAFADIYRSADSGPRHTPPPIPAWPRRHAIVIGAGIAGAAVVERLARSGGLAEMGANEFS